MGIKILQLLFSLLLFTVIETSQARAKILIAKPENWSHPTAAVFEKYGIILYKVRYSKDGTCPTFYGKFKYSPVSKKAGLIDFNTVYSEILKANSYFPYALVDKEDNIKINVGWNDKAKKIMVVDIDKASVPSQCKGNSHANIDDDADFDKFMISAQMKKNILNSPYKAFMQRGDGKKFVAYLYAEKVSSESEGYYSCKHHKWIKRADRTGIYYIYLYDVSSNSFFPGRVEVFNDNYLTTMNVPGSDFFVLALTNKINSDVLFISQYGTCDNDNYEAYGFSENHPFLKKYTFVTNVKRNQFYGKISKIKKNGELIAYGKYNRMEKQKLYLTLSDRAGEIQLLLDHQHGKRI